IIAEKEVELILVGMPRNMDGTYGPAAQKVQEFIDALRLSTSLPVQAIDERLTSVQANRVLIAARVRRAERKQKVDPMAAAILLQAYLDARPA
ncbi:MAG TPA: Holliday junction resolvase RuvX, partial [Candidatus Dormibacteraeota bacterium]|nr:Holliday junction resolvase RuvX [Candidatus Dormibacteraeota bacterium]